MSKPKLALIPSGYKSGKVYSILPNDATGDFDITRASGGTRVRKDGLIEEAKTSGSITNLQPRSEEFDNSVWIKTRTTITADQELAPNGTNTADKLTGDGTGTSYVYYALNFTASQKYTISIYVKPINVTTFSIQKFAGGTGVAFFDLSTGTISSAPTGTMSNPIIESLSNGWFRCSAEHIPNATGSQNYGFGMQTYNGDQFYIWGAMVSEGALSDYIKTEGSQVTKRVETFTDVPRLDWLNSNCPSLLLEPQRTNYCLNNTQLHLNSTLSSGATITLTGNYATAPNGTLTATRLQATGSGSNYAYLSMNGTNPTTDGSGSGYYRSSVYVKSNTGTTQTIVLFAAGAPTPYTREVTTEWSRIEILGYRPANAKYTYIGYGSGADEELDFLVWGGQTELVDSYASSLIYTGASTVTRLKDECLNGGDSDLFNIIEGTFFVDANNFGTPLNDYSMITISDGTGSNYIRYIYESSRIRVSVLGLGDYFITGVNDNERNKVATTFKENEMKVFFNGSLVHTDTLGVLPTDMDRLNFASQSGTSRHFEGKVYDTRFYDRVLTEAEAIELTTL